MRIRHLRIESFPIAFRTRFRHTQAERGRTACLGGTARKSVGMPETHSGL